MGHLIWIYTVCKDICFGVQAERVCVCGGGGGGGDRRGVRRGWVCVCSLQTIDM